MWFCENSRANFSHQRRIGAVHPHAVAISLALKFRVDDQALTEHPAGPSESKPCVIPKHGLVMCISRVPSDAGNHRGGTHIERTIDLLCGRRNGNREFFERFIYVLFIPFLVRLIERLLIVERNLPEKLIGVLIEPLKHGFLTPHRHYMGALILRLA
ncbi:hypothetical protein SDC9_179620 [bioreactor metagenome]|uniref:Uncharacterized protein n=1 Tax=bioreactor metagenome TaxID=1076179 RepID=A0A645H789_9ZZZZ